MDNRFKNMKKTGCAERNYAVPLPRCGERKIHGNNYALRIAGCKLKAGFTIEAAVIVPLSMFIIIVFMYVAFYLHDCVIIKTVGPYYILENADSYNDSLSGIEKDIADMLDSRLIIAGDVSVALEEDDGLILKCSADFDLPLNFIRTLLGASSGSISTQTDISMLNARETLLEYKAFADITEGLSQ